MEICNFLKKSPSRHGQRAQSSEFEDGKERRKTKEAEGEGKPTRIVVKDRRRKRVARRKIEVAAMGRIMGVATVREGAIPSPGDSMGAIPLSCDPKRGDPSASRSDS